MDRVKVNGKFFKKQIDREAIKKEIKRLAAEIDRDMAGSNPLVICVMTGAMFFAADLLREVSTECEITSVRLKSYEGTGSTGHVSIGGMLKRSEIEGRNLLIIEDIVDTGLSLSSFVSELEESAPASIRIAALLSKPDARKYRVKTDYLAFEIPNLFVVGYGLDYDGYGRGLKEIYILDDNQL